MAKVFAALVATFFAAAAAAEELPDPSSTVYLANLTWPEVRQAIDSGKTVALLPTGGIEQNGAHMTLGKHDIIVTWTAGRIAEELGNALVAPVMPFVPEGGFDPISGHMLGAGTITLAPDTFGAVLDSEARSMKAHGFRLICFIGDHGESQPMQERIAAKLSAEWQGSGVRVVSLHDYYAKNGQEEWLLAHGETTQSIGRHGGIEDTSELLALRPANIRQNLAKPGGGQGSDGDPNRASAERGRVMLELKVATGVKEIRSYLGK